MFPPGRRCHNQIQMMEQKFSVRNATDAATAWAATPVGILVRVEVLVTVSCTLLATMVFFGSGRRTSRSAAFRFLVWLVLMLCYPAVSYTIGLIQSGSFRNDLVVVWACFLLGCADGIFSCSVDDSDQQSRAVLNQATQVIYVLLLLLSYVGSLPLQLKVLLLLLWVLNLAKLGRHLWSLLTVTAGRDRVLTADNWLISNYMAHDYVRSVSDFDPVTMRGYSYVITGHKDVEEGCTEYKLELTDDLVTVERLWQHDGYAGSQLRQKNKPSSSSSKLKDLCLSFALFKLLRRRLSGNNSPMIHEHDDIRTLVFARNGLAGGDDHERMFRVIETELGFLSDFFYAQYPSPKQSLIPETAIFVASMALSLSTLLCPAMLRYHKPKPGSSGGGMSFVTTSIDIWLARFVIALFLILELYQYMSLVLSDWHKVKMLCRYVRKPSWQGHPLMERLLWLMCRATLTTRYWSHSVGQYSLLHACLKSNRSCILARMPLHKWIKGVLTGMKTVSRPSLPVTVKRAIHRLLRSEWLSNLKYGDRTLQRNNMLQNFDWSTSRYPYGAVGSILVWHIATAICGAKQLEAAADHRPSTDSSSTDSHEVATTLSNYCTYLLYQAPELVTDKIYDARLLMEALQNKIQRFLKHKGCRSKDDMFDQLSRFQSGELDGGYEKTILADGIKLSYQIFDEMPDEAMRWNVLSEMWVELLLSVAPSDNVTAHIKKLATGGELVTQLWALLTHGGLIDKPKKPNYSS